MAIFWATCEDLVIASGQTTSRAVNTANETIDAWWLNIQSPATLPEICTIEVSHDSTTWTTLNNGTSDVSTPGAGKGGIYENLSFPFFRIKAGTAVGATRTFKLSKAWNAY